MHLKRRFCTVWDGGLKERFNKVFLQRSSGPTHDARIPVAQFVSSLYELDVLNKKDWPTAKILEDMHQRGYAKDVFTKPSYGAENPPPLSLDECLTWVAYFRVRALNSR
jgi:hypothetical protein